MVLKMFEDEEGIGTGESELRERDVLEKGKESDV